jgi:hypothetical protein
MEKQVHKIAKKCIVDGKWIRDSYDVVIGGETYDFRDLAKEHGIELNAKPKKQINTDIKEKDEDLEQSHDSGDTEVDGDGDSESTE